MFKYFTLTKQRSDKIVLTMNWQFWEDNCNLPQKIWFNICHASVLIILYNKACAVAARSNFFEAQTFRFESRSNR